MNVAAGLFDRIAQRILSAHQETIPDLRGITILLPNFHVARPLAQALLRVAKRPVLLLPQMVTLNQWAQSISIAAPVMTDCQRSALLYQLLRDKKWFGQADLWSMTQELLTLFDELTYALKAMPGDAEEFAEAVQYAYHARKNTTLQLEARLVFELWYAMQSGEELDAARLYQQRLAALAAQAHQPLFVLRTSDWNSMEQRFLELYAVSAEVVLCDLREMTTGDHNFISTAFTSSQFPDRNNAFPPNEREGTLRHKSNWLKDKNVPSISQYLHFFAATSLEQEALAAAMQVRIWLQQGKRDIAIVAQDRVVARRMRALLERAEIMVADETGWTFATLSVSTVVDRWLSALQSDFYHHDLLDLLKSPYIFADVTASERKAMVYQLEKLLRKQSVVAGLEKFITLSEIETALQLLLERLHQAAALMAIGKKKSLAEWLGALRESMRVLGVDKGLQQDEAGEQLLGALEMWQQQLRTDNGLYRFNEWRRWLAQQLDSQNYRDSSIDSPVHFTHLAATRWRKFDAVLLLGCDADHLPGSADGGRWFNDAVRGSLNLPTRSSHAARQRDDLLALLTLNDCVLVTWQKEIKGEMGLLSPYFEMLRDLHRMTYDEDLSECELQACLAAEESRTVNLARVTQPFPSVSEGAVPATVSISAYNSLVACPYQFYARYILRLNELDEVQEGIEKRDYGELVHDILRRFHQRYPLVNSYSCTELEASLRQISETVFADLVQHDFAARAWKARWFSALPSYIQWQLGNEADGWQYSESESSFDWKFEGVRLRGRIDRLDTRGDDKRVLDYKTQGEQVLRNKLREAGEDVQLACYAYAYEAADAAFVSIDNGKVKIIEPEQDVPQLALLNAERLVQVITNIRAGAPLPANGIDAACEYCEMRGLCRKGGWA